MGCGARVRGSVTPRSDSSHEPHGRAQHAAQRHAVQQAPHASARGTPSRGDARAAAHCCCCCAAHLYRGVLGSHGRAPEVWLVVACRRVGAVLKLLMSTRGAAWRVAAQPPHAPAHARTICCHCRRSRVARALTDDGQVCLVPAIQAALQVHNVVRRQPRLVDELEGRLQRAAGLALSGRRVCMHVGCALGSGVRRARAAS